MSGSSTSRREDGVEELVVVLAIRRSRRARSMPFSSSGTKMLPHSPTSSMPRRSRSRRNASASSTSASRHAGDDDALRLQLARHFARHLQADHPASAEDENRVFARCAVKRAPPPRRKVPPLGDALVRQPALAVERRHAAGAGGGDGLAVDVIDGVAAGEDALDVRRRRMRDAAGRCSRARRARAVPRRPACSACGRWRRRVPASAKSVTSFDFRLRSLSEVTPPSFVPITSSTVELKMNSIFGLPRARSCMIFDARNSSRRWTTVTLRGELGEERRLFHRRVAAADDDDLLVLEEESVAGRAVRDAEALQRLLGRQVRSASPTRRRR